MGKLGLNSGYIGSDQRTTRNGVVGYDKYFLERINGRFFPVLEGDPDAEAFFQRVVTAGGTLSTTEQLAVTQLVIQMKADGIWDKMKAIYPMVGASAAACAQNLKSSSFTGTFSGGWTFASTGATPNGSNAFYNTLLNPSLELSQNNLSIGIYSGTNISNAGVAIGCNSLTIFTRLYLNHPNDIIIGELNDGGSTTTSSDNRSDQFVFVSRTTSPSFIISKRGTLVNVSKATIGTVNFNIFFGASNNSGTSAFFSPFQHRFTFIGEGLNTTECNNYYTAVQAFQTTLGRAVAP
jgi:hypothetical protein